MAEQPCPLCEITQDSSNSRLLAANEHAFVIADGYPVSGGHTLIITIPHVSSFSELNVQERASMFVWLYGAKPKLGQEHRSSGYNIGVSDSAAAGQTVPHFYMHLIPRYDEPGKGPSGGVRWLVPEKADYWSEYE